MKIGIVGLGFVGLSLTSVLASKGFDVIGIDIDKEKSNTISKGISPFFEPELEKTLKNGLKKKLEITDDFSLLKNCDLIFLTVGTPQNRDGSIDLSIIKKATKSIGQNIRNSKKYHTILIKSTVVPGTTKNVVLPILEKNSNKRDGEKFGLITNPEFLQESTAIRDTKFPHAVVLGGYQTKFMKKMNRFYTKLHPNTPIIITNHQTAEMIKYANNSFLATKISFINQLSNICQKIPGSNVDDIAKTMGLDPRIGKLFLNAGPGYGGSCLPKDMKALINFADEIGIKPTLLNAVEQTNKKQIQNIIHLIEKTLGSLKDKHITVLGTAFKPNTDDIRDSIAVELIKKLLRKNANVTVYDPKAIKNTNRIFGKKIIYANSIPNSLKNSQCMIIMVHWKQFEKINNNSIRLMKKKFIIDCRRVLSEKQLNSEYHAIGIGKQ